MSEKPHSIQLLRWFNFSQSESTKNNTKALEGASMEPTRSYLKLNCKYELHILTNIEASTSKDNGKNYMKDRPPLVRYILRNRPLYYQGFFQGPPYFREGSVYSLVVWCTKVEGLLTRKSKWRFPGHIFTTVTSERGFKHILASSKITVTKEEFFYLPMKAEVYRLNSLSLFMHDTTLGQSLPSCDQLHCCNVLITLCLIDTPSRMSRSGSFWVFQVPQCADKGNF